jgi:hypothetical protein
MVGRKERVIAKRMVEMVLQGAALGVLMLT